MKKIVLLLVGILVTSLIYSKEVSVDSTNIEEKEILILGKNKDIENNKPICVYSNGTGAKFPKGGLLGLYNPSLSWSIGQCSYTDGTIIKKESLILVTNASDTYFSFDEESRILIRFTDDSVSTLYRDIEDEITNEYSSTWFNNNLMHFYTSYVRMNLDNETRTKLLNPALGIKKIRIVFTNGNIRDFEITGKRVMKLSEEIRESYIEASQSNKIRTQNNDDSNF